jgi:class 3 adenylate cyclase
MKGVQLTFLCLFAIVMFDALAQSSQHPDMEMARLLNSRDPWDPGAFQEASMDLSRYFLKQELPELGLLILQSSHHEMLDSGSAPGYSRWYLDYGKSLAINDQYELALSKLFMADSLSRNDSYQTKCLIHQWMGICYSHLERFSLAEMDLQLALQYCDSSQLLLEEMEVRYHLALAQIELGDLEESAENLKRALLLSRELNDLGMRFRLASIQLRGDIADIIEPKGLLELRDQMDQMVGQEDALLFAQEWMRTGREPKINERELNNWKNDHENILQGKRESALHFLWMNSLRAVESNGEISELKNSIDQETSAWDRTRMILFVAIFLLLGLTFYGFVQMRQLKGGATRALKKSRKMYRQLLLPFHLQNRDDGSRLVKRQPLILLMVDLVNFGDVSRKSDYESLIQMLDDLFSAFERIGDDHQLDKVKSMGETYLAAGGFTALTNVEVTQAMEAAFQMMEEANRQKMKASGRGLLGFNVRIGLHIGELTYGVTGWKKKSFDIWGEAVVEIARIVRMGTDRYVHASEIVVEHLNSQERFEFHPLNEEEQGPLPRVYQVRMNRK